MQDVVSRIQEYTLEEIMGNRFGRYSKSIIQDRALPDVRDGLKPVQRRILYGMYREKHTFDKPTVKSARCVGDIMGKFHPHGDSSIYDAMVRMSQWWKQNTPFIDMQGNNGSMDGDSAAAMRYTESKLSKIAGELMKDIDRGTITWAPNFDDTLNEPTVLPAKFPNLLVNGSNGISAGYATNIPPHNLGEVIDAAIKRIDSPNSKLETITEIIKGPDFPTGGIVEGKNGIIDAFKTGRGKVVIKAKYVFEKDKVIITEIPFDVNKQQLVKKIEEIKVDKKIEGISEVRDESDREEPVRIVIDLKKGSDKELIMNYLLKNTELMINYNYNMVAIVNRRPMTLGILEILDAYLAHLKEVLINRTKFDLEYNKSRMHIVSGLIKALSILDEVISTIRASKNKQDAINNLVEKYEFSVEQATAIVVLQLYRLTNTDVTDLENEFKDLQIRINVLELILSDENKLKSLMKEELRKIKNEYATERKTQIKEEVTEIKIDTLNLIPKEEVIVVCTSEGYIKRVSLRSYDETVKTGLKDGDFVTLQNKMNTMDTVLMFTNLGNYLYLPVYEIPDLKWKDLGKHVSNIISMKADEVIISSIPIYKFDSNLYVTTFTKNGMVKRSKLDEYKANRYTKAISAMKLKDDDEVISVNVSNDKNVFIVTENGYALNYLAEEIPVVGIKASGVKAINLKNDKVVFGNLYSSDMEYVTIITDKKTAKRVKIQEFEISSRAKRGLQIIREVKTNPYKIIKAFIIHYKEQLGIQTLKEEVTVKLTEISIADRHSSGSTIVKDKILNAYVIQNLKENEPVKLEKENISLDEIDKKMMTIDDFLDNIE